MFRPRLKTLLGVFAIISTLLIIGAAGVVFSLEAEMSRKLEQKKLLEPTEFFADGPQLSLRSFLSLGDFEKQLQRRLYRARETDQRLLPGDYFVGTKAQCESRLQTKLPDTITGCVAVARKDLPADQAEAKSALIFFDSVGLITEIHQGAEQATSTGLEPERFAQYLGTEPLMQEQVSLGEIPPACLNAVMAIEDRAFLEHIGFSFTGLLRSVFKNLATGRYAQGGSTITQQLVRNYFLTTEKTIKRKIQELAMSVLLETKFSKDEILETYLNVIYMGQNGAFRVHGYGSASRYYFGKPVSELDLPECALLAAIVNNPGGLNPWKRAEAAMKRRDLVLTKMEEFKYISEKEMQDAKTKTLPKDPGQALATETAPYFIDAVRKQMRSMGLPLEGVKIYTSLDLEAQQTAQEALQAHLAFLEKENRFIRAKKEEKKMSLEGVVLSGDPRTGLISVAVGGRSFRMTQFNRAVDSRRQVGSIMKPFVFLAALDSPGKDGRPYTPISLVTNEKFEIRYEGQRWSPENFEKDMQGGQMPLFYALKNSVNIATAALGIDVGLKNIIVAAQQAGIESPLKEFPSLTLGAFEIPPREVLQASMTLAALGARPHLSFIREVEDRDGKILFKHDPAPVPATDPVNTAVLVGMMKQTLISGTARASVALGFNRPAAGKTGTTSDFKDTWFMGFTPYITSVVWVGYDDNTPTKLTGASGALPVWIQFMKKAAARYPAEDFTWPEGTVKATLGAQTLKALNALGPNDPQEVQLIFKAGTEPGM